MEDPAYFEDGCVLSDDETSIKVEGNKPLEAKLNKNENEQTEGEEQVDNSSHESYNNQISDKSNELDTSISIKNANYFGNVARKEFYNKFQDMQRNRLKYTGNESILIDKIDRNVTSSSAPTRLSPLRKKSLFANPNTSTNTNTTSNKHVSMIDWASLSLADDATLDDDMLKQSNENFYSSHTPSSKVPIGSRSSKLNKLSSIRGLPSSHSISASMYSLEDSANTLNNSNISNISDLRALNKPQQSIKFLPSNPSSNRLVTLPYNVSSNSLGRSVKGSIYDSNSSLYDGDNNTTNNNGSNSNGVGVDHSPRTKYLGACIRENITPLAKLV